MPRYRITIMSRDREALLDLVRVHKLAVFDHGIKRSPSGEYTVHASAEPAEIQKLRTAGYHVDQHEDVDEHGKARQRDVGKGDRYKGPGRG